MFQIALIALLLQTPAAIQGMVVRQGTGEPVAGATLQLNLSIEPGQRGSPEIPPDDFHRTAQSDRNGRFVFENVRPGEYQLIATHSSGGYVPGEFGQRTATGQGISFRIAASQTMTGIVLTMAPTGSISGRVYDEDGEPVGKAQVQAMRAVYKNGQRALTIVQAVQSDDRGEYRLFWLAPGQYYVAATPDLIELPVGLPTAARVPATRITSPSRFGTFEEAAGPVITKRRLKTGEVVEETHLPVYFPGIIDPTSATPIPLPAGAAVGGIDFSVGAGRVVTHHIRGRVINSATGQPQRPVIRAVPRDASQAYTLIPTGQAATDGSFDIAGVTPGFYRLVSEASSTSASVPVDVGNKDLENVPVVMSPGFTVTGRFIIDAPGRDAADMQIPLLRLTFNSEPATIGMPGGQPSFSPPPTPDGVFKVDGVSAGDFRLTIRALPQTAYVKSIRMGSADVLNDGLHISGPPENPIEVVIGLNAGSVEGTVVNARQEALANRTVVLVPDIRLRQRSDLYKSVASDSAGHFQLAGVTPGSYRLFAWDEVENGAWQDPDFIRPFEAVGKPVQVNEGGRETVQLTVIP